MEKSKQPKAVSGGPAPGDFSSSCDRTVERGRFSFPPEWRGEGWPADFALLPWPLWGPQHLAALPPAKWEALRGKVASKALSDTRGAAFERLIQKSVVHKSLDDYGRLPLPEGEVTRVAFGQTVTLVGMGDHFEIWSPDQLKAAISVLKPDEIQQMAVNLGI